MPPITRCPYLLLLLLLLGLAAVPGIAYADIIYGLTASQSLIRFPGGQPAEFTTIGPLTGVVGNQTVVAIDFRPRDGTLFALSYNNQNGKAQLYRVNRGTGRLKPVGATLQFEPSPVQRFSIDFNPVDGTLRAIGGGGGNYCLDADTGVILRRGASPFAVPEQAVILSGTGFTNNYHGASETLMYAYNYLSDQLVRFVDLDSGATQIVGHSGLYTMTPSMGFDISSHTGLAYLNADSDFSQSDNLYKINLTTGRATLLGTIGVPVTDISVQPESSDTLPSETPVPAAWVLVLSGLCPLGLCRLWQLRRLHQAE
ncbi:MAG: DUF4394 domain-containing protein [Gemmataceae bacterium]